MAGRCVQPADDDEAIQLLADHNFDLDQTALLDPSKLSSHFTFVSGDDTSTLAATRARNSWFM
ncbi:MAG: hypothetical protein R2867_33155 [Caldilineaceae bacterium]